MSTTYSLNAIRTNAMSSLSDSYITIETSAVDLTEALEDAAPLVIFNSDAFDVITDLRLTSMVDSDELDDRIGGFGKCTNALEAVAKEANAMICMIHEQISQEITSTVEKLIGMMVDNDVTLDGTAYTAALSDVEVTKEWPTEFTEVSTNVVDDMPVFIVATKRALFAKLTFSTPDDTTEVIFKADLQEND